MFNTSEKMNPLISIIVPIYGVEQYLDQCVESIVSQTYQDLEIILVDDGSKDQCPEICDQWAEKDQRIKVIHKVNGGLSDARNAGIRQMNGDYVSFIDSDDWIDQSFIQKLYEAMVENQSDVAECSVQLVGETGNYLQNRKVFSEQKKIDKKTALEHLIDESGIYQTVWNKLYKKEVIEGFMFKVGKHHEDEFWTYKVIDRISSLSTVEEPLYFYRQRESSIMGNTYSLKRLEGLEAKYERYQYFSTDPVLSQKCSVKLLVDCLWNLQAAARALSPDEFKTAREYVLNIVREMSSASIGRSDQRTTTKIWLHMFRLFPTATIKIRNVLKVGL